MSCGPGDLPFVVGGSCNGGNYELNISAMAPYDGENIAVTALAGGATGAVSGDGTPTPTVTYAGTYDDTSYTVTMTVTMEVDGVIGSCDGSTVGTGQGRSTVSGVVVPNPRTFVRTPAAFWHWQGEYMASVTVEGQHYFAVFDFDREEKIAAWWFWSVEGVTAPVHPSLVPYNERMYFIDDDGLYYFDANQTDKIDTNDGDTPFESVVEFHFNDLGRPGVGKKFLGLDLEQTGASRIAFSPLAHDRGRSTDELRYTGISTTKRNIPMALRTQGVAPVLRSTDRTGWVLEALALHFDYLRR